MAPITLRPFTADDAPWITEVHGAIYQRDDGFDETFKALVGSILKDFIALHDTSCERGWVAMKRDARVGCIFCTRLDEQTAQLRLFLLLPEMRGKGLGKKLLSECMGFARKSGYRGMQLWTHESHRAACALYRKTGWTLLHSKPVQSFGRDLVEQSWTFRFDE